MFAIGVLTIFGKGFGDLICPSNPGTICAAWRYVPKGEDYLASSVSTLALLRKEKLQQLETDLEPEELTHKLFWMSPCQPFHSCPCIKGKQTGKLEHHDPVQYIVSKAWLRARRFKEAAPVDVLSLEATGAVLYVNLSNLGRRVEAKSVKETEQRSEPPADTASNSGNDSLTASGSQSTTAQSSGSTNPTETSLQAAGPTSVQSQSRRRESKSMSAKWKEMKGKLKTFCSSHEGPNA